MCKFCTSLILCLKQGKDIRDLVVRYKDKVIRIIDVEMEKYNYIELFRDARASVKESGIEFPKYVGFRYHPPNKENQRCI